MTYSESVFFDQMPGRADSKSQKEGHASRAKSAHPWPFAAHLARVLLDPGVIERHGVQILARAMSSRRLMAFAGAGITMPHGRMTWAQLLDSLYDIVKGPDGAPGSLQEPWRREAWESLNRWLWPEGAESFKDKKYNYTITAQLFEEFWPSSDKERDREPSMRNQVAQDLGSCDARFRQIVREFFGNESTELNLGRKDVGPRQPQAAYLQALRDRIVGVTASEGAKDFWTLYKNTFVAFGNEGDSPISLLVNQLGVRRFLTTNYDHEIENALCAFDYPKRREGSAGQVVAAAQHGTVHSSVTIGPTTTAQATRFAADGPRRHASVLHLHGTVTDAKTLIVTEPDYQGLYLDRHSTHDLVQNAISVAFGGNPILFIGSNVGEDDILRPLRQFMTGAAHQRDRQAVALLPAKGPVPDMVAQKLEIYLRYGVHAIHYGFHHEAPAAGTAVGAEMIWGWLRIALEVLGEVEKQIHETGTKNHLQAVTLEVNGGVKYLALANAGKGFEQVFAGGRPAVLPLPTRPEGVEVPTAEADALLDGLIHAVELAQGLANPATGSKVNRDQVKGRLRIFAQELQSSMITFFLNARLRRIGLEAAAARGRAGRIPTPVQRRFADYDGAGAPPRSTTSLRVVAERKKLIYHRHRVVAPHRAGKAFPAADTVSVPASVRALACFLGEQRHFTRFRGRRTLVVSSRRGFGKGTLFDALGNDAPLALLTDALGGYQLHSRPKLNGPPETWPLILHFNLSFSDEVAGLAGQMATLIGHIFAPDAIWDAPQSDDLLERMALALDALLDSRLRRRDPRRCLLMLGNAGVLFDERGNAKSGQVARLLQMMSAPRYLEAPLDVMMFCEERQIPKQFRSLPPADRTAREAAEWRTGAAVGNASALSTRTLAQTWPSRAVAGCFGPVRSARSEMPSVEWRPAQRRLRRLNVKGMPGERDTEIVFPVPPPDPCEVWETLLSPKSKAGRLMPWATFAPSEVAELSAAWSLLSRSRLATTMVFAFVQSGPEEPSQALRQILRPLIGVLPDSCTEHVIEGVLDGWFQRHLRRVALDKLGPTAFGDLAKDRRLRTRKGEESEDGCLTQQSWRVLNDVLWHLSAFSHPVELSVLVACEAIRNGLVDLYGDEEPNESEVPSEAWLAGRLGCILSRMVAWCLVFLVEPRPTEAAEGQAANEAREQDRYTVHRQLQKHMLRQAGGRNVETVSWDQFTTTLYASQPDESPVFERETHVKLVRLIQSLSIYPCKQVVLDGPDTLDFADRIVRLRAAYFVVRSTFSLGAIARSKGELPFGSAGQRAMEEYALLVSWVIDAALALEDAASRNAQSQAGSVFFAGEIVWLYNEWGVIRLAQGKLADAEEALALAEAATRHLEPDDSGSVHVRVRLQAALVQIERGHSARARTMLQSIADRATGHEVPRLIAKFYIGLIEHIGGAYRAAEACYDEAATGLRRLGRPRALAMVMLQQADLHHDLNPNELERAVAIAREAVAIAQQGGHEDVRVLATLTEVRLRIEAFDSSKEGLFSTLSSAERYAERMDMPRIACTVFELRARLLFGQGETHMAAAQASESLEIAGLYDLKLMKARAVLTLAGIYAARGDIDGAADLIQFGRQLATSSDYFGCLKGFDDLELKQGVPGASVAGRPTASASGAKAGSTANAGVAASTPASHKRVPR